MTEQDSTQDAALEAAWRAELPALAEGEACELDWSSCAGRSYGSGARIAADGARTPWPIPPKLKVALSKARAAEARPGEGAWTLLSGRLEAGRASFRRDFERRTYAGTHEGMPLEPPAAGGKIIPSDADWTSEFLELNPRDADRWPSWLPAPRGLGADAAPAPALDAAAPLPGELAALSRTAPWSEWIAALRGCLERRVAGDRALVEGLAQPADSEAGERARDLVMDDAPVDFWGLVDPRPCGELVRAWEGLTGREAAPGLEAAPGTIADARAATEGPLAELRGEVEEGILRIARELLEAGIRR